MMNKCYMILGLCLCSLWVHTAWAQESEGPWKTRNIEAGGLKTSGNTSTSQFNLASTLKFDTTYWGFGLKSSMNTASDRGRTTAQNYTSQVALNYNYNKRTYMFLMVDYERDIFSFIDFQFSESIGLGYHAVLAPPLLLDLEVSAGMRQIKTKNVVQVRDAVGRFAVQFKWQLNPYVSLEEVMHVETGQQGTVSNTETSLVAKLNSRLSSKMSFKTRTNSKPAIGVKKTDTETAVLLTYHF